MSEAPNLPARAPEGRASSPVPRFLAIGIPLFLAAGAFYLLLWPRIETSLAINGLASENSETARDLRRRLRERTDAGTDQALLDAVADGDRAFRVRLECVDLLLERNRLTALEALARSGDRATRSAIYARLAKESFFKTEILPDPSYRVAETVKEWLADPKSEGRDRAIALAQELEVPDVMQYIRPLLVRSAAEGAGRRFANETLIGAAVAVERFKDCESVPQVAALAESDPDIHVRMRVWDVLERLALGFGDVAPLCPGSLSPERVRAMLSSMLDARGDDQMARSLRMRASMLLARHPDDLPTFGARLRAILDGRGAAAERREALSALVSAKDAAIGPDLPRYAHDRDFEVRSAVAERAGRIEGLSPAPLWIGLLRDETASFEAVRLAHVNLKLASGRFIGLPADVEALASQPPEQERALNEFLQVMVGSGASGGLTREAWAEAWYRWYAETQGLAGDDLERALAARRAFRAAMDRGDVPAAKKALEGAPTGNGPGRLYLYEEGWLAARG